MFIESVEILNYGPFAFPATLKLEPDVTVLTGPNDAGKSSLLNLLLRAFSIGSRAPEQHEFNLDAEYDQRVDWQKRDDFRASAVVGFGVDETRPEWTPNPKQSITGFKLDLGLAPQKQSRAITRWFKGKETVNGGVSPPNLFNPVLLPSHSELRDVIQLEQPTPLEQQLFQAALGQEFQFEKLIRYPLNFAERHLGQAEKKLNSYLRDLLSTSSGIGWKFRTTADRREIHCQLEDAHGSQTPLGLRGTGIRKVMAFLAGLHVNDFTKGHWLVLFDEPETSLHADSQHLLRRVLEELAKRPNVQVVYATHSPSMINPIRPHSVRLVSRTSRDDRATSVIDNAPYRDTFLPVRASLGLTAADSLLYAPITVVVEGATEVVGLPLLLRRLAELQAPGFGDADRFLSQAGFVDGIGDSYEYLCRIAKAQGAKPLLFLDGDKAGAVSSPTFRERHPDVPVVFIPDRMEFEQLVKDDVFFRALADLAGERGTEVTLSAFRQWEADYSQSLPDKHRAGFGRVAFTKRLNLWMNELELREPNKPQTMRRAIELVTDPNQVIADPLIDLLNAMKRLMES